MPRKRANMEESEKSADYEEQVDYGGENDSEEVTDEEVEYEEVEEEEEFEEIEEVVEEEVEEDSDDNEKASNRIREPKVADEEEEMKGYGTEEEDERQKHAELLALPPHGSEVYIGGFSLDATEDDLRGFCQSVGEVTEVRIMKGKDSGDAKRYAFVCFRTKELAVKAIDELNNSTLKGKKIKCSTSQGKHRLFIGNVPKTWEEEDMTKAVKAVGPGVLSVQLVKDPQNSSRNRGFAFIEYYNNACAEYSRQKMANSKFKLDDNAPTVSWADPRNAESSAASSQVKAIYVKNLPKDITQDRLRELFEHHGKITKVVLPPAKPGHERSRYGFVHFTERSSAMKALKNTEKYEINGQVLECSLAKPHADQKSFGAQTSQNSALIPNYPPRLSYGALGAGYGAAFGAGYGAPGLAQPLIFGGGSAPAGMAMMPMLLPDGRIGYVLQQPGTQLHTPPPPARGSRGGSGGSRGGSGGSGGSRGGSSGRGGRRSGETSHGHRRYHPY